MEGFLVFALLVALIVVAIVNAASRRGRTSEPQAPETSDELSFRRILVPFSGELASDRAVSLACKIARPDKAVVEVLYVVEVPMALPPTADMPDEAQRAAQAIQRSEHVGRTYRVNVRGMITKSRFAGKAIVDAAQQEGADLIVLPSAPRGRPDWSRTSEFVLRNASCDVIIERARP